MNKSYPVRLRGMRATLLLSCALCAASIPAGGAPSADDVAHDVLGTTDERRRLDDAFGRAVDIESMDLDAGRDQTVVPQRRNRPNGRPGVPPLAEPVA
jgi:hypothetical protein